MGNRDRREPKTFARYPFRMPPHPVHENIRILICRKLSNDLQEPKDDSQSYSHYKCHYDNNSYTSCNDTCM